LVAQVQQQQPIGPMVNDPSEKDPAATPPESTAEKAAIPAKPTAPVTPSQDAAAKPAGATAPPAKPAAPAAPAAAPPKAPAAAPPKETPPKPVPLDNELVQRLKAKFGEAIREASLDRKQAIVLIAAEQLREISRHCRDEEKFNMLVDLSAVDWPKREKRFDIVLNLHSFAKNERLRLKAQAAEGEPVPSVCDVWPAANWLERECYDMFGIVFEGHPDLKRILMPDEWQGYPLRKDYDILRQDTDWVRENLGIESAQ
jgi:NADH-quinone oxidoreductase subunit C